MTKEIRWQYRFKSYSRAYTLLREALEESPEELTQLAKEGIIQRFEFTFELAWKLLKDRMEYDGINISSSVSPRRIIRQAFQTKLIEDCESWLNMLIDRNLTSHTYSSENFETVIRKLHEKYLSLFDALYDKLSQEMMEE